MELDMNELSEHIQKVLVWSDCVEGAIKRGDNEGTAFAMKIHNKSGKWLNDNVKRNTVVLYIDILTGEAY